MELRSGENNVSSILVYTNYHCAAIKEILRDIKYINGNWHYNSIKDGKHDPNGEIFSNWLIDPKYIAYQPINIRCRFNSGSHLCC